jgi:DNA-binding NarL/FixJ family response regulator
VFSTRIVGSLRAAQEAIAEEVLAGIILDVRLPDGSGLDLFRHLADQGITTRVLVLTGYLERAAVAETQMYGAEFLTKPFEPRHVEAFINRLRSATPARDTWRRLVAVAQERGLTERETEVVSLHLLGLSRTAIAERLRISINTVKMHISAILQKTGADSLNDLTARVGAP